MVRYEDLFSDPARELGRIAEFLPLDGTPERIESALRSAQGQATAEPPGKWRTILPESAVQTIESVWGTVMTAMGYALASVEVGDRH
jgi:hypothetical protein